MTPRIEHLAEGNVILHPGDCLDVMRELAPNSIDSCVTDPPYGLGFMGKHWDHGVPGIQYWKLIFRVLKPGAHLLACGGTRTYHRMACAIEDAGFEIRDSIQWLYGSGFPKSLDVSKAIDKAAGVERQVIGRRPDWVVSDKWREAEGREDRPESILNITAPATDAAREWDGWGTALKPACEPIVLARKPLSESTVAANVLKWGTGALNIDGCRVAADWSTDPTRRGWQGGGIQFRYDQQSRDVDREKTDANSLGRWPANVIHDGSDEVVGAFPETQSNGGGTSTGIGYGSTAKKTAPVPKGDSGSAARFFYTAKADSDDRLGSKHPTVKPLDLMQYLVRLVTPPKGLVLDPFAGTGTTGEAVFREGMRAIMIEREEEYQNDIRRRMSLVMAGSDERARESIKAKTKDKPIDHGPLFGVTETAIERPAPAKQEVLGI